MSMLEILCKANEKGREVLDDQEDRHYLMHKIVNDIRMY